SGRGPAAGRRGERRIPESGGSGAESASSRVPWGCSVYHSGGGPRVGDSIARQRPQEADRQVDIKLDVPRRIAACQRAATVVAERQRGALTVGNPQGQVSDRRQRPLD